MGRQAYLTRLALGRSPFEEPELTESGDFVLGSHAHDLDNQADGYVQQFDEKGHPENKAAKAAAKEFRHAKNEALETIGVVTKKNKGESRVRIRTEKEKVAALVRENSYGPWLKAVEPGFTLLSLWWLMSLRSRFQTFRSFSSVPLVEIVKSEIRNLGPLTFFTTGLLAWLVTMPVTFCRQSLVEITSDSIIQFFTSAEEHTINRQRYPIRMNILCQILDFTLFAFSAPVLMFSDLQILHLIPPLATPSLNSLIPFTLGSPIAFPRLSGRISGSTVLQAGLEACKSPFLTFWLYDRARHAVEAVNYRIVCATVPRPDLPDKLSKMAARKGDEDEDTILGLWLADGPTLLQQIQYEMDNLLNRFRSWKKIMLERPTQALSEEDIQLKCVAIERDILFGPITVHRPRPSEAMAREIRRLAARLAWEEHRQTPPTDIDAWIGLARTPQTSSTNTPDPRELFPTIAADTGGDGANDYLSPLQPPIDSTPFELLQPEAQPDRSPSQPDLEETHNIHIPARSLSVDIVDNRPFLGHDNDDFWQDFLENYPERCRTLFRDTANGTDGQLRIRENLEPAGTPPPIRRARLLASEDSLSVNSERSRSRQRERRGSRGGLPRHRVTSLSNYPADAFAYHMSIILTTAMMLPLEGWYLRALARGFLANPAARAGGVAAAMGIGADVRSLQACFGGEGGSVGRLRYASVMMLIWGMQMVISAGVWDMGTRVAVWIGRSAFGWGRPREWELA